MLSIGIQLSIQDFALAFKRLFDHSSFLLEAVYFFFSTLFVLVADPCRYLLVLLLSTF